MCSYCGCRSIALVGKLMDDHEFVTNMFTEMRASAQARDADRLRHAAQVFKDEFVPHGELEERTIFVEMRADEAFTEAIDQLIVDHRELTQWLDRLIGGDFDLYHRFENRMRDHMDREDNGLFPASAIMIDGPTWESLNEAAGLEE